MNSNIYTFYSQTGMSFVTNINVPNNFFSGDFILLNSIENAVIKFNDGKLKNKNDEFFSSFNKNGNVQISGNLSSDNFNIFIQNKLIYFENKNYGFCTGVEFKSNNQNSNDNFKILVYGDKPSYFIGNQDNVYSEQPISCYISGYSNNISNFNIYSINIGGTLDANVGNSSYVPRNFFEISGQNSWESGLKIAPNQVYNFYINQKSLFDTRDGYTYIPIYIETEFGTIYKRIFVKVISPETIQKIFLNFAAQDFIYASPKYIDFQGQTFIRSASEEYKNFFIYISGLNGNNVSYENHVDTFTGSWGISMEDIDFYPQIIKNGNIAMYDNTDNLTRSILKSGNYYEILTGASGQITGFDTKNQIGINSGIYQGIVFNVPYIYNTTFNITGINFGIYSFGNYTGIKTQQVNSGISGGNISVSLYSINKNYRLESEIASQTIFPKNINDTGNNSGNIFNIFSNFPLYTNKNYAILISGYSSGYQYGYNLFLPTGNNNYNNSYINYISSISGKVNDIQFYPAISGEMSSPYIRLMGEISTDNNILSGYGLLDVRNRKRNSLKIYKIYNYNNSNLFTGSALIYVSGFSGLEISGKLSVYHDMFRQVQSSIEIF